MKKLHFDGQGNPTLDYPGMLSYYAGDGGSIRVLRNFAPYKYLVIPTTTITLRKSNPFEITVRRKWPAGSDVRIHSINQRVVNALRRLYKSQEASWRHTEDATEITWTHRGRVVQLPVGKYSMTA